MQKLSIARQDHLIKTHGRFGAVVHEANRINKSKRLIENLKTSIGFETPFEETVADDSISKSIPAHRVEITNTRALGKEI